MWLNVKEAAEHIGSSRRYLDELRAKDTGPKCYFVANKWVYKKEDLDSFVMKQKRKAK